MLAIDTVGKKGQDPAAHCRGPVKLTGLPKAWEHFPPKVWPAGGTTWYQGPDLQLSLGDTHRVPL